MGCAPSQNKSHESDFSNNVHQQQQQNKQKSKNDENNKNNNNNKLTSQQQEVNLANDFTAENQAAFEKEQKAARSEFATSLIRQFSERNVTTTDVNFHESSNDINDKINLARIASLHTRLTSVRSNDINAIKNTNLTNLTNLTNNSQSSDNNNNNIDKLSRQLSVTHSSLANGMEFDTYNMENISNHDKYDILCSAITPRPIVFISTIDTKTNIKNLAPMSFAAPVTSDPPSIMISITTLNDKKKVKNKDGSDNNDNNSKPQRKFKDTLINIQQNGEFVINHLTKDFFDKAYQTSEEYPPEIDEFDQCGLTPLKSDIVAPYRVLESPMQLECKCIKIISINGDNYGGTHIVVGEVVATHVRTDLKINGEMVNEQAVETVSRLGALRYGTAKVDFEIKKGAWSKDNW